MKDFLEQMEDAVERRHEEMTKGVPSGHYRCACGRITPDNEMNFLSQGPCSEPSCGECLEKFMVELLSLPCCQSEVPFMTAPRTRKQKSELVLAVLRRYPSDWWTIPELILRVPFQRKVLCKTLVDLESSGEVEHITISMAFHWRIRKEVRHEHQGD